MVLLCRKRHAQEEQGRHEISMFMTIKSEWYLSTGEVGKVENSEQFRRTGNVTNKKTSWDVLIWMDLAVSQEHWMLVLNVAVVHQIVTKPLCSTESSCLMVSHFPFNPRFSYYSQMLALDLILN